MDGSTDNNTEIRVTQCRVPSAEDYSVTGVASTPDPASASAARLGAGAWRSYRPRRGFPAAASLHFLCCIRQDGHGHLAQLVVQCRVVRTQTGGPYKDPVDEVASLHPAHGNSWQNANRYVYKRSPIRTP
ncbi:hypothetical protein J6590_053633 [Homalodisca vitripennis]|nr:hypothetical protein J6590_053633 [Homalodisca vitripennis]